MSLQWKRFAFACSVLSFGTLVGIAVADQHGEHAKHAKLPPGPIRERHELMEGVGKNAKKIGTSLKQGKAAEAAAPADAIAAAMDRVPDLFPPGSTHPDSRAKAEIWREKPKFDERAANLKEAAQQFAAAARSGGDVKTTSNAMWGACKSCHDSYRVPKEGE